MINLLILFWLQLLLMAIVALKFGLFYFVASFIAVYFLPILLLFCFYFAVIISKCMTYYYNVHCFYIYYYYYYYYYYYSLLNVLFIVAGCNAGPLPVWKAERVTVYLLSCSRLCISLLRVLIVCEPSDEMLREWLVCVLLLTVSCRSMCCGWNEGLVCKNNKVGNKWCLLLVSSMLLSSV